MRAGMINITDIQNLKKIKAVFKLKSTEIDIKKDTPRTRPEVEVNNFFTEIILFLNSNEHKMKG